MTLGFGAMADLVFNAPAPETQVSAQNLFEENGNAMVVDVKISKIDAIAWTREKNGARLQEFALFCRHAVNVMTPGLPAPWNSGSDPRFLSAISPICKVHRGQASGGPRMMSTGTRFINPSLDDGTVRFIRQRLLDNSHASSIIQSGAYSPSKVTPCQ